MKERTRITSNHRRGAIRIFWTRPFKVNQGSQDLGITNLLL